MHSAAVKLINASCMKLPCVIESCLTSGIDLTQGATEEHNCASIMLSVRDGGLHPIYHI